MHSRQDTKNFVANAKSMSQTETQRREGLPRTDISISDLANPEIEMTCVGRGPKTKCFSLRALRLGVKLEFAFLYEPGACVGVLVLILNCLSAVRR